MRTGLLDPARLYIDTTRLSKSEMINTVAYYYGKTGFPGFIYIALEDCSVCYRGGVVDMLCDSESPCDFVPIARIDELILNIPTQEYIKKHGLVDQITTGGADSFWKAYNWEFTDAVGEIQIEWEQ